MDELFFEPEVIDADVKTLAPKEDTQLAQVDLDSDKKIAIAKTREALDEKGIDLDYILWIYKDAAESAVVESFSGTILEDHKTRISAANKMLETWKVAHGLDKKDPVEIVFKPLFAKPPMMN